MVAAPEERYNKIRNRAAACAESGVEENRHRELIALGEVRVGAGVEREPVVEKQETADARPVRASGIPVVLRHRNPFVLEPLEALATCLQGSTDFGDTRRTNVATFAQHALGVLPPSDSVAMPSSKRSLRFRSTAA